MLDYHPDNGQLELGHDRLPRLTQWMLWPCKPSGLETGRIKKMAQLALPYSSYSYDDV